MALYSWFNQKRTTRRTSSEDELSHIEYSEHNSSSRFNSAWPVASNEKKQSSNTIVQTKIPIALK